jgi:peroxiredoxin (alkyl hydroperoxide reductase subunit C)
MAFERRREQFAELNTELIGLSVDQVFAHIKWVEWIRENRGVNIQFPVIADELGVVSKELGMLHPGKGTNTVRSVFIVDADGIIRLILYYPQEIGRNMDEVLRAVKALQTSDEHNVATPANWPENEDVGSNVIVPPADSEEAVKQRFDDAEAGEIECFDWWFCHKEFTGDE